MAAIAIPEKGVGDFSQQNVIKASKDSHTTTTTGLIESCDREDNVSLLSAIGNKMVTREGFGVEDTKVTDENHEVNVENHEVNPESLEVIFTRRKRVENDDDEGRE